MFPVQCSPDLLFAAGIKGFFHQLYWSNFLREVRLSGVDTKHVNWMARPRKQNRFLVSILLLFSQACCWKEHWSGAISPYHQLKASSRRCEIIQISNCTPSSHENTGSKNQSIKIITTVDMIRYYLFCISILLWLINHSKSDLEPPINQLINEIHKN